MVNEKKKIGVLTGGGDCPGLNNAIREIVLGAHEEYELEGIALGWEGPIRMALSEASSKEKTIETYTLPLGPEEVRRIDRYGGTILMASRANPYEWKVNDVPDKQDVSDEVIDFLNDRYLTVIAIGGEDTLGVAGKMAQKGLRVIGVPKTIDKDLCATEYTLGFDSAVNIIGKNVTDIKYTAGSHGMVYFIETMGRHAGHLAYWGGRAANTHFLTIPEIEVDYERLFELIQERKKRLQLKRGFTLDGLRYTIVVVSEGTRLKGIGEIQKGKKDSHGNVHLGGVAEYLCKIYTQITGDENVRSVVLGHLQRAGPPSHKDRYMGQSLAQKSLGLLRSETFGRMVSAEGNHIGDVPLEVVIDRIRILDPEKCFDPINYKPVIPPDRIYNEIEVPKR